MSYLAQIGLRARGGRSLLGDFVNGIIVGLNIGFFIGCYVGFRVGSLREE